jgi:hypothetical protein
LPHPWDTYDGGIVVASVWLNDDEPDGSTAVLLILEPTPEHYRVQDIQWQYGGWKNVTHERFVNIVPAVEFYKDNGGDY